MSSLESENSTVYRKFSVYLLYKLGYLNVSSSQVILYPMLMLISVGMQPRPIPESDTILQTDYHRLNKF